MNYFFTKYIVIEDILEKMDEMDLSDEERWYLASLIDSSLHHAILSEILSNLNADDKRLFIKHFNNNPGNEKLLEFLNERIDHIEDKIKKVTEDLRKEMHEDIKKAKKVKNAE
ncbi:hypothetical protein HY386_00595 [Candidatus Daviesbacteria bacterium]|nr:hypothetical protein [Candidatus Daviesbacteria bacterium]